MVKSKKVSSVSRSGSFQGYSFKEALVRNKDAVKAVIAVITGANYLIGFDWRTFAISLGGGLIALGVKLLADAVDFYFGEIEL